MNLGTNSNMERVVTDCLIQLGIQRGVRGFDYLRYAIMVCVEDSLQLHYLTTSLYPGIALKFDTTPSGVERGIRHAIETSWPKRNLELAEIFFGSTFLSEKRKPTNGKFIATISDEIRLNLA